MVRKCSSVTLKKNIQISDLVKQKLPSNRKKHSRIQIYYQLEVVQNGDRFIHYVEQVINKHKTNLAIILLKFHLQKYDEHLWKKYKFTAQGHWFNSLCVWGTWNQLWLWHVQKKKTAANDWELVWTTRKFWRQQSHKKAAFFFFFSGLNNCMAQSYFHGLKFVLLHRKKQIT